MRGKGKMMDEMRERERERERESERAREREGRGKGGAINQGKYCTCQKERWERDVIVVCVCI